MTTRIWFDTREAAAHTGRHPETIRRGCESGELHGHQRRKKGRWAIHRDCLDAWMGGAECEHQGRGAA